MLFYASSFQFKRIGSQDGGCRNLVFYDSCICSEENFAVVQSCRGVKDECSRFCIQRLTLRFVYDVGLCYERKKEQFFLHLL